ncbi:hypothetical protein A3D14_00240 [Candidatus Saccharibacteria bacterium RIFCSPHIGHO2_02_FULL_47_12]|nr:MAG: hypothetical protein A3D14_00240 [Candidatus Saccharibacteria bacterium RIFCSPHIGHO2_02_FULL_47_12]
MNHGKNHLIVMGIGFAALLILSKFVGASALLLFFFFCLFMMATMMHGMGHDDHNKGNGKGGRHGH